MLYASFYYADGHSLKLYKLTGFPLFKIDICSKIERFIQRQKFAMRNNKDASLLLLSTNINSA